MKPIYMNLNDEVDVTLTAEGAKVINDDYAKYSVKLTKPYQEGDQWTGPIWEFSNIFGSKLYNGSKQLIVGNELTLKKRL